MRFNYLKTCLKTAVLITTVLLLGAGLAVAQQTINLTAAPNTIPTSLTIVGQLGGGLGTTATSTVSPPHATQGATWPVADASTTNDPAAQGPRVQSFSTEVAAGVTPTSLTWTAPRPGTYLL